MNFRFLATKQKIMIMGTLLVPAVTILLLALLQLLPVRPYIWLHVCLITILFFSQYGRCYLGGCVGIPNANPALFIYGG